MSLVLFEDYGHFDLLPFTFTRPAFDLRMGIYTPLERWSHLQDQTVQGYGYAYLQTQYPAPQSPNPLTWVNGRYLPEPELLRMCAEVEAGTALKHENGDILVAKFKPALLPQNHDGLISEDMLSGLGLQIAIVAYEGRRIAFPEDIFRLNGAYLRFDFPIALNREAKTLVSDPHTRVYGADNLLVHPTAKIRAAVLNAEDGPIYIGPHTLINEGALIHGAHAVCAGAKISMGAKMRGDTTVGPRSKIGGEVANSVIMGFSNKGHDGYLGNSVLGHWCNIGANTNNSNLKNNYANIRIWHYPSERFRDTGLQFCGLMMGDHSKTGISTMINTGTVVGVSCNIFGSGFPRNYIPSFSWGGASGFTTYRLEKALETAALIMTRRGHELTGHDRLILKKTFEISAAFRRWE
jgi:UDP-N-acetylglucosamine diphosphorylase/glucosamine-1-phosphate N-acetyltransferase